MPPFKKGIDRGTPQPVSLAEEYSYADVPRPFKNPEYRKNVNRRNKTLKQILAGERERVDKLAREKREREEAIRLGAMEVDPATAAREVPWAEMVTYATIEAPPSLQPAKKYCDVTGLEAPYVDPRSMLRYHNAEIYEIIKTFQPAVIQTYLAVRGRGLLL